MSNLSEQEELEMLRRSAAKFITDPLEKAFFTLETLMERDKPHRIDSVMPTSAFFVLARALIELKRELIK